MRVAHHLDGVRIRRATMADASLLWRWANDPDTACGVVHIGANPLPPTTFVGFKSGWPTRSCLLLISRWNGAGRWGRFGSTALRMRLRFRSSVAQSTAGVVGRLPWRVPCNDFRSWVPSVEHFVVARVKSTMRSRRLFERRRFRLVGEREGVFLLYHASASADATS